MLIQWNEEYHIGIEKIDEQHKQLVSIINHLDDAHKKYKNKDAIDVIFQQLRDYCENHFLFEESALLTAGYSNLDQHKIEHDIFSRKIKILHFQFCDGEPFALSDTLGFLCDWLIIHILSEDKKYVPYLNSYIQSM